MIRLDDLNRYNVLISTINYKNSDYSPTFFKSRLVKKDEYLKTMEISCVFLKNNKVVENIESVKDLLINNIIFDNNYEYEVFLESMSELESNEDSAVKVVYRCRGNIYLSRVTRVISGNGRLDINSNKEIPVNIKITNGNGTVVINNMRFSDLNTSQVVKIDGEKGTVTGINYDKWLFSEFPKATKSWDFRITGNATITVDWRCKI